MDSRRRKADTLRRPPLARALLPLVLVAVVGLTAMPSPTLHATGLAACALYLLLATAWENARWLAALWSVLGLSGLMGASLWRLQTVHANSVDMALDLGLAPLVLVLVAAQSRLTAEDRNRALESARIARAKLQRSNTELRSAMAASEAALVKLETIVANLSDGLLAIRKDGRVEFGNPALEEMLEVREVDAESTAVGLLPRPLLALVSRCVQSAAIEVAELELDDHRVLAATASPITLQDELWGSVVLIRDVTTQRQLDRMKSDFAATVSHEMRTPLTSVLGFTKLLKGQLAKRIFPHVPQDDKRANRAVGTINNNLDVMLEEGERLSTLINDVMDISKMESGQMVWDRVPTEPSGLVQDAVDRNRDRLSDKPEVTLALTVAEGLPPVQADVRRVSQVLDNLLRNAIKFTDAGELVVSASLDPDGQSVRFAVRDTGIGIRPAHQAQIFDTFKQVGDVLTDRPQGTGLGLPICREIVTQHGGRIWVDSDLGAGATFAFTLPFSTDEERGTLGDGGSIP